MGKQVYRKTRGESRAIYTALADDHDFLSLSPNAKLVWYTLKMQLGASGIGVMYPGQLADLTGLDYPEVEPALAELEAGDAWLLRDRNVMWLRNGLRFDPYVTTANRKHLQGIVAHLAGLPRVALIERFCALYGIDPEWIRSGLPDGEPHPATPPESHSGTLTVTLPETLSDTGERREEEGEELHSASNEAGLRPPVEKSVESEGWSAIMGAVRMTAHLDNGDEGGIARSGSIARAWLDERGMDAATIIRAIEGWRDLTERGLTWIAPGTAFGLASLNGTATKVHHHSGEILTRPALDVALEAVTTPKASEAWAMIEQLVQAKTIPKKAADYGGGRDSPRAQRATS